MSNVVEDANETRTFTDQFQKAMLNLLEDMNAEREELAKTQRALLNILEDVEVERVAAERARSSLESANKVLRERSLQLAALTSELTLAEQRERQRLARVLHDGLQQTLVSARMRLEVTHRAQGDALKSEIAQVGELIAEAIEASRLLTTELSPRALYEGGLIPALEGLARLMRKRYRLTVNLNIIGTIERPEQVISVMLYEATRELLFNVVKHAAVEAATVDVKQVGNRIRIDVADNGRGFDPSDLRAEGGSRGGFGLFSIRERLDLLGGTMEIQSAPDQGCRFTLIAPLTTNRMASEEPADKQPHAPAGACAPGERAEGAAERKIRIVLVDDHADMRRCVALILDREQDIELVGEASDGVTAVEAIRRLRPDAVLMDISLPGLSGIEATRVVHSLMPDVRIIGFSMSEEPEQIRSFREAGAVAVLVKSGTPEALLATVRACVDSADRRLPSMSS